MEINHKAYEALFRRDNLPALQSRKARERQLVSFLVAKKSTKIDEQGGCCMNPLREKNNEGKCQGRGIREDSL